MPLHHWVRVLVGLSAVPAFAVASDAFHDAVQGQRWCLDSSVAARSPELTSTMCSTVGVDGGPLPKRFHEVVGGAVDRSWSPIEGELRRAWASLG